MDQCRLAHSSKKKKHTYKVGFYLRLFNSRMQFRTASKRFICVWLSILFENIRKKKLQKKRDREENATYLKYEKKTIIFHCLLFITSTPPMRSMHTIVTEILNGHLA